MSETVEAVNNNSHPDLGKQSPEQRQSPIGGGVGTGSSETSSQSASTANSPTQDRSNGTESSQPSAAAHENGTTHLQKTDENSRKRTAEMMTTRPYPVCDVGNPPSSPPYPPSAWTTAGGSSPTQTTTVYGGLLRGKTTSFALVASPSATTAPPTVLSASPTVVPAAAATDGQWKKSPPVSVVPASPGLKRPTTSFEQHHPTLQLKQPKLDESASPTPDRAAAAEAVASRSADDAGQPEDVIDAAANVKIDLTGVPPEAMEIFALQTYRRHLAAAAAADKNSQAHSASPDPDSSSAGRAAAAAAAHVKEEPFDPLTKLIEDLLSLNTDDGGMTSPATTESA